ncbi:MAG: glycosyltransferase family 39 protein [Chloroflexi bacterium]|nr:glycosyltransferase family 39 protein [Chloroflexota bacterium]
MVEQIRSGRVAVALFLFALLVRVAVARATSFDGLYGQDPFAYFDYSIQLRDALNAVRPPPPFFWPLGYPLPVALTMMIVGARPMAGQLVSIIAGAFVASFVYELVRDVAAESRTGALVASLLTVFAAQLMISSLSVMSDVAGLAWITFSAWMMARYLRTQRLRWLSAAAFALGWAVLTRWVYALMIVPWAISALIAWRNAALQPRKIIVAASLAVAIGGIVVGSQFALDLGRPASSHVGDLLVVGWNPVNALHSTIANSDGLFRYERPIGVFYALPAFHPAFVFPLLTPFLLLGLWALRRAPRPQAALLVLWLLVVYIFLAGIAWENPRFSLALFPPLAALVGIGVEFAWTARPSPRWRSAIAGWCAIALMGSALWSARDVRTFVARKQADLAVAKWAEAQVPPGATVLTFGLTETLRHYTSLSVVELYNEKPDFLDPIICGERRGYALVDEVNVESQWAGKSPAINLRWLRDTAGLIEMGRMDPYALFRAGEYCRPSPVTRRFPAVASPPAPLRRR